MRGWVRNIAMVALLLAAATSAPAQEQDPPFPKFAIGMYSGGIFFSDFNESDEDTFGDFNGGEGTRGDLSLESGFVVGMNAETWLHPQFAIRMNGSFTEQPFELEREEGFGGFDDNALFDGTFGAVNVWEADMNVMYRPLSPLGPLRMIPFLSAGAGVVHYNPAGEGRSIREATVFFDEETKFAAVGGIGLDIAPNTPSKKFGAFIRMELADHYVFDSPAERLSLGLESDDEDFDGVHNLRLNLGMMIIFPLAPKSCPCP
jgi:opacity protein-like surface antigen